MPKTERTEAAASAPAENAASAMSPFSAHELGQKLRATGLQQDVTA